jgi:hypothetical protein
MCSLFMRKPTKKAKCHGEKPSGINIYLVGPDETNHDHDVLSRKKLAFLFHRATNQSNK